MQCIFFYADKDECVLRKGICGDEALCFNTDGAFKCECPTGFKLWDKECHSKSLIIHVCPKCFEKKKKQKRKKNKQNKTKTKQKIEKKSDNK